MTCCEQPHSMPSPPPPVSCGHFDQICTLVSLTDDPCFKQNVYSCLCESLCRLMPQFMQIKFLPLIFKALTYRLTSTLALTDYPITATRVLNSAADKTCSNYRTPNIPFTCIDFYFKQFNLQNSWGVFVKRGPEPRDVTHVMVPPWNHHTSCSPTVSVKQKTTASGGIKQPFSCLRVTRSLHRVVNSLISGSSIAKVEQSSAIKCSLP